MRLQQNDIMVASAEMLVPFHLDVFGANVAELVLPAGASEEPPNICTGIPRASRLGEKISEACFVCRLVRCIL